MTKRPDLRRRLNGNRPRSWASASSGRLRWSYWYQSSRLSSRPSVPPAFPVGTFTRSWPFPASSFALTLLSATDWATIYFSLLLLAVLAIVWWQVQGWLEVVEEADEGDEELRTALDHLVRARRLDNAVMLAFSILIAAAIGNLVATFIQNRPQGVSLPLVAGYIGEIGIATATCLIAAVAIWSGLRFRGSVDEALVGAVGNSESRTPSA